MTPNIYTDSPISGSVSPYLNSLGHRCDLDGLSILLTPPGKIDLEISDSLMTINTNPFGSEADASLRLSGQPKIWKNLKSAQAFFGGGGDVSLKGESVNWQCLLEFNGGSAESIVAERANGFNLQEVEFVNGIDPETAVLSQLLITHLKQRVADRLYVEGLANAITARTLSLVLSDRKEPTVIGTDRRIDRVIDYIHANVSDGLTVGELAKIACMSASWFSRSFKAKTGFTVHAYVLERRLERAMLQLSSSKDSIADVAWTCGFADHSHLSRLFRRRYGIMPSEVRQ